MRAIVSFFLTASFIFSFSGECLSFPQNARQAATERFKKMDSDNSGSVTREEFFRAQPNMKESAFSAIDTDNNGEISQAEWETFMTDHNKSAESTGEGSNKNATQASPLLMPGKAKQ